MIHQLNPLGDAGLLCDTLMNRYPNPLDLPPAHRWHYHQGVFLLGVLRLGQTVCESSYISYVDQWIGELVGEDGSVDYTAGELDALQPANLLFHRLDVDSDGRYRRALDLLMGVLDDFPRTDQGGFWHKLKYPNQQWLDGLYMIGPLSARYSQLTGDSRWIDDAVTQAFLIADGSRDEKTGLLRHGFDRSRSAAWVRNGDMRAPESWGRALGWFPAALLDILDWMPDDHSKRDCVKDLFL
ncbi:MAG: glycoside hydrolase family 88 protein, partial [Spirochaetaceae bacterium]|nr:glycoside hydrolase family 88 protein [Spirochaetaceae bacterium]